MSIINDALKKVQNDIDQKNDGPTEPTQTPPPVDQTPVKPKRNRQKLMYSLIIICAVIAVLAAMTTKPELFSQDTINKIMPKATTTSPQPAPNAAPAAPAMIDTTPSSPIIEISGIMKIDDKYVALIQDDVYEVGHHVNNMLIENITEEMVVFDNNGKKVIVSIAK